MVKGFVEAGNTVIQVLDEIISKLGGMPTLISAAIGATMSAFGGGINLQVDPLNGKNMGWSILGHKIGGAFKNSEISVVEDLFTKFQDTDEIIDTLAKSYDGLTDSTREYVREAVRAGNSSTEIVDGMKKANKATGVLSTSIKSLGATIVSIGATMIIAVAIEKFISLIYKLSTATKNVNDNISALSTSFKETKDDINNYKNEISDIYDNILNSDSSSLQERKDARERLIEIQDLLISKYGEEKEAVDLITESIDGEISALDTLIQKKWAQLLIDIEDPGGENKIERITNRWLKQFNLFFHGVTSNYELALQELNEAEFEALPPVKYKLNVPQNDVNVGKRLSQEFYKWFEYNDETGSLKLKGNLQEIVKYFDVIREQAKKYGASDTFLSMLDEQAANAKFSLESLGEFVDLYSQELFVDNPRLNQYLENVKQIGEKYNEAFADGFKDVDEESILREYYQALLEARQNIDDPNALQYIENLNPDISSKASLQKFKDDYKNNIDGLQNEIQSTLEQLKESLGIDLTYEDLINFNPNAEGVSEDQKQIYNHLTDLFRENDFKSVSKFLRDEKEIVTDLYKELSNLYGEEFVSTLTPEQLELVDSNEFKKNLKKQKQEIVKEATNTVIDAKKQIEQETQKIQDWGLGNYKDQILNDTIQHQFGNVDMDNRGIIEWNNKYLKQWEDALKTWEVRDESGKIIGNKFTEIQEAIKNGEQQIDTVFGSSDPFKLGNREIEVAYSPIMVDENGTPIDFLSQDTVQRYIQKILNDADKAVRESGEEWTPEAVYKKALEIDLTQDTAIEQYDEQGNIIGSRIVKGIIAGIGDYTGEGGSKINAALVGMLMHFVGDYGAFNIAAKQASEGQNKFNESTRNGVYTQEEYAKALAETENQLKMQKASNDALSITDFSNSLAGIKKLTSLYKTWKQQVENNPTKVNLDITEVESALRSLGEKEGIDISGIVGSEEFENFERIVGDSASTTQQVQAAFDSLGEVIVENSVDLSKLTKENAALVQSQLEGIGVTNAEAVVKDRLAQITQEAANQEAFLAEEAALASGATYEEATSCAELAGATEITRNAVFLLVAQEEIFSNQDLNISGKVAAISELASAHLSAANAAKVHAYAEQLAANAEHYGLTGNNATNYFDSMMNKYLDGMEELNIAAIEVKMDLSGLGGAASDAGKKAGNAAKDAADKTKEEKDAVDELQDAYTKLKKIQEDYNKNGKITVDQAQELMKMDFRYLSMLKLENGALKLNEQAFKSATQAKLEELKITMMRNALNTMQSITTEAQAEAYLAMCTAEANMATGEAVALQAALESQMQGTTGAIADAYNMIYQGLQNALSILGENFGNVDFSSLANAAEDSTKDVAKNAEEEFEKVFDWLERRMNVLQKKADLFAAKRANADMTYFDRYSGYNGYLNKEINIYKQQKALAKEQVKVYTEEYQKAIEGLDEATVKAIEGNGKGIKTITDKNMADAIDKAIEWKDKIDDAKISIEEIQTKINDLSLEKFNYLADVIERKMKKVQRSLDFSDFYQGMLEATGYASSSSVYKSMADDYGKLALKSQKELQRLEAYRQKLIDRGLLIKNSKQDLEMQDKIAEVEKQVLDYTLQQAEAEKSARDAVRERFDYLQQIQNSYEDELNSINGLFYSDQAIDDEAHYTSTAYGMMATQQYAYASNLDQVQKYKQALAELEEQHRSGEIGAQEYQDREQSLRASMYESAEAAKAAKDAIIDLAKERIEKEISIIEDQIKAYKELIDKQKEALKSAKDLHDYEKSIAESRDDLAKITRKLAAIENDTSQSAIAQRKKLEQEYADAKAKLEEKEYQHSISTAEKNLDKQAEAYEKAKNVEIKRLQEKLKDVEALFSETTGELSGHMTEALQGMTDTLEKYGVSMSEIISNAIISGVKNGTTGSSQFLSGASGVQNQYSNENDAEVAKVALEQTKSNFNKEQANYAGQLNSLIEGLYKSKIIDARVRDKWTKSNKEAGGWSNSVNSINETIAANNYSEAEKMIQSLIDSMHKKKDKIKSSLSKAQREQLNAAITAVKNWTSKLKNRSFATGVHKLNKDELAWTQELGNEAILSPTRNAILTPLKSGDTVLTAAQTDNLFKMAKNPFDFLKDMLKVEKVQLASTGGITMQIDNVLTVQGDVNDSNAKEMAAVAQQAITKAFNEFSSKIKK